MILPRYLAKKFLTYFILCAGSLTLLSNFVEFFEKLGRTPGGVISLAYYIFLNLTPTFFMLIPLCSWLAAGLLLWEFSSHERWQALHLLGISPTKPLLFLCLAGFALSIASFAGQEILFPGFVGKAQQYKELHLKHKQARTILNTWFSLGKNTFLHVAFVDMAKQEGEGLTLLRLNEHFALQERVQGAHFSLKNSKQELIVHKARITTPQHGVHVYGEPLTLSLPELFVQLPLHTSTPSALKNLNTLMLATKQVQAKALRVELAATLGQLLGHARPLIVLAITLALFFVLAQYGAIAWLSLAAYPAFAAFASLCQFATAHGSPLLLLLLPYLLALTLLCWCYRKLA